MPTDLFESLLSNAWAILLVVLFFGGSIFVHELGHFLAARWCGLHVERFSIGFGPAIFSWRSKAGIEYRIAWLPLGGYVALPQIAAMEAIEGKGDGSVDYSKLAPASYGARMLTLVAGAAFNLIFALGLACIIWAKGMPTSSPAASTTIGYVALTLSLEDGREVPSPAHEAGLRAGDRIAAIDGQPVADWSEIVQGIITGSGRTATGTAKTTLSIEREGAARRDITVYPLLAGPDQFRRVGIDAGYELIVHEVAPGSVAASAGFTAGDELRQLNGERILNVATYADLLAAEEGARPLIATVLREGREVALTIPPRPNGEALIGLSLTTGFSLLHPSPGAQIVGHARTTWRTLTSLINPGSDIGLSKMSGPVGIARILHSAAQVSFVAVLMFTVLINVNLAIFNLLPIPVLDGGQMLFATIAKLRRRALPASFVMATQSAFMVLLFGTMFYVTIFGDIRRLARDFSGKPAASQAESTTEEASE